MSTFKTFMKILGGTLSFAIFIMSFVHWDALYVFHLGDYPTAERGMIMLGVGIALPFVAILLDDIGNCNKQPKPPQALLDAMEKDNKPTRPRPSDVRPPMTE